VGYVVVAVAVAVVEMGDITIDRVALRAKNPKLIAIVPRYIHSLDIFTML
jgi:hypothetical protein